MGSVLAGCSSPLDEASYVDDPDVASACESLYEAAPATVVGQDRRAVTDERAIAWGANPIVLRCGVTRPAELTRSSRCDFVAGVGWLTEKGDDAFTFTTIGRRFYVSVQVPRSYEPPSDALVDLASLIKDRDLVTDPCV